MDYKKQVMKGMSARLATGKFLGTVSALESGEFLIAGQAEDVDYVAGYDQIAQIRGDEIILLPRGQSAGADFEDVRGADVRGGTSEGVTLSEEKVDVMKHTRKAGEVRVRKRVITERQTLTVPVMQERVSVERVPASAATAIPKDAFQEKTVTMPVSEEEVELRKRTVAREQVRVRKERTVEERRMDADVRREVAEVEERPAGVSRGGIVDPKADPKTRY